MVRFNFPVESTVTTLDGDIDSCFWSTVTEGSP